MKKLPILFLLCCSLSFVNAQKELPQKDTASYIQIVFLLDASGSMQGLLAQAQSQIWDIYQFITQFEKDSLPTIVEFGLFSYGHSIYAETGHINYASDFTADMDQLYSHLFSIEVGGGEEYCGQVIASALDLPSWRNNNSFKSIFIAGNEDFDQGKIDYKSACLAATESNILINTIFCGDKEIGIKQLWDDAAQINGGAYTNIDHNKVDTLKTPYDGKFVSTYQKYLKTFPEEMNKDMQIPNFRDPTSIPPSYRDLLIKQYQNKNQKEDIIDQFYLNDWQLTPTITALVPSDWQKLDNQQLKRRLFMMSEKRNVFRQSLDMYVDKIKEFKLITAGPLSKESSLDEAIKSIISEQLIHFGFSRLGQ